MLEEKIIKQINYYFSDKNLENDKYMKKIMSEDCNQGFPIINFLEFKRIRQTGVNKD